MAPLLSASPLSTALPGYCRCCLLTGLLVSLLCACKLQRTDVFLAKPSGHGAKVHCASGEALSCLPRPTWRPHPGTLLSFPNKLVGQVYSVSGGAKGRGWRSRNFAPQKLELGKGSFWTGPPRPRFTKA